MSKNKSGNKANVSNPTITKRHIDTAFSFLIHEVELGNETVVRRLWESVFYDEESLADAYMHDQDLMEFWSGVKISDQS